MSDLSKIKQERIMEMEKIKRLTEAEEVVMMAIWDFETDVALSDIWERVTEYYGKDWKPQTVSTFLAKLVQKHYLAMYKSSNKFFYKTLISRKAYKQEQLKQLYVFLYKENKQLMRRDVEEMQ